MTEEEMKKLTANRERSALQERLIWENCRKSAGSGYQRLCWRW